MSKSVWKSEIFTGPGIDQIALPEGAVFLSVQTQGSSMVSIWAEIDYSRPSKQYTILTVGTGAQLVPDEKKYIGTYQIERLQEVYHVFELLN